MLILVTGGSASGKSEFAENLAVQMQEPYLYIATMHPFDEECRRRIERHRRMRAKKRFETLECYKGLKEQNVSGYKTALLECMSNLVANEMYQEGGAGERCVEEILAGVHRIAGQCRNLIIVTNEIFADGIDYGEETVKYQNYLGRINCEIGRMADLAVEVVCSIPIVQKGNWKTCEVRL